MSSCTLKMLLNIFLCFHFVVCLNNNNNKPCSFRVVQRSAQNIAGRWQHNSRQRFYALLCHRTLSFNLMAGLGRGHLIFSLVFGKSQCVFDLLLLSPFLLIFHCHRCFFGYDLFAYCFSLSMHLLKVHS